MASAEQPWSISAEQREDTRARMTSNLIDMAFSQGGAVSDSEAVQIVANIERKAYATALAEAETTTGTRPHKETTAAYTRKLSALLLEAATQAGQTPAAQAIQHVQDVSELDLSKSEGEFLTAETAEELLAPALTPGAKIVKIKFSNNSFIPAAADVAARAICNNSNTLVHAVMSDIIAGRPEKDALQALVILSKALSTARLISLDLSGNALGEKGIRACEEIWAKQPALEQLALQNVGLSIRACQALSELFAQPGSLKGLHFRNNMTDDAGAAALATIVRQATALQEFRLASSRVGPEGGIQIAGALQAGTSLISLELMDNPLTSEVVGPLGTLIRSQPQLKVLNLSDTGLGDEGVSALAEALSEAALDLEVLELDLNEVTPSGAQELGAMLVLKNKLKHLSLRENELEDKGAVYVARSLALCNELIFLDLSANQLTAQGALSAAQAVVKKPHLKSLELNENQIPSKAIAQMKEALQSAGKLDALGSLEDNEADDDDDGEDGDADMGDSDAEEAPGDDAEHVPAEPHHGSELDSLADALAGTHIKA